MLAIVLAIVSSLAYGISDFLGGLRSRSVVLLSVLLVSQGTALVLLSAIVASRGAGPPTGAFLLYAAIAGLSETVGVAALYRGLAVGVMSIVAPTAAAAPVVPVVAGAALGELPAPVQGGGIVLALAGIVLISLKRNSEGLAAPGVAPSIVLGLLAALGFGGFFLAMDAASEGGVPWALLVARLTAVTVFVVAAILRRSHLAVRGGDLPVLVLIGVLIVGADSMYAIASTRGLLSVVAVLSSLDPVVTIGLARVCLRERVERPQLIGITASLLGVAAISAP